LQEAKQQQIPCGNDNTKDKSNSKGKDNEDEEAGAKAV